MESAGTEPSPRKNLTAEARRELLTQAALRVMKRDGVAAATTRAICAEAGMPHGAFHYCFRSKRELYAALLATDINVDLSAVWPAVDPAAPPVDNLRTLFRAYWEAVVADPEAQRVLTDLTGLALREPELRGLPAWEHRSYLERTAADLERFAEQAHVEYAHGTAEMADLVLTVVSGATTLWLAHGDDDAARRTLDRYAVLLAALVRPRP
ncbi:TetR/AcrR family transcriptional regulator [Streptomyces bohaiensis]|uniref:TetR/AcrR family transcriptional regulator n=1 Tax=Streptomyces bohaiensis TaxID=1431344 RepID=A0ABX1CCU5_9ACTN|nr:TetR/AcrR family transcriptional regulator [Streptomyces bohaiensis]NJQ14979.1 TetR/AcrR family transcriptional regulator [Streptomyces bohaiensis]